MEERTKKVVEYGLFVATTTLLLVETLRPDTLAGLVQIVSGTGLFGLGAALWTIEFNKELDAEVV